MTGEVLPRAELARRVAAKLGKYDRQIAETVPKSALAMLRPERVVRLIMIEAGRNPELMECTPESVIGGMLTAASLGLEIGAHLGHAYLIPFKGKATFVPGYKGLVTLAVRSGLVRSISAYVVRGGDTFSIRLGTEEKIEHVPSMTEIGEPLAYYAIARMADGGVAFDRPMLRAEIEETKKRAPGSRKPGGPWSTDFDEMARKTVVRRLCKYLPLSGEAAIAVAMDESIEANRRPAKVPDLDWYDEDGVVPGEVIDDGAPSAVLQSESSGTAIGDVVTDPEPRETAQKAKGRST